jgi:hypothetical protein
VGLYPSKDLTAESLALALFQFFVTYGVVDVLVTDAGSNIDSEVTRLLLDWFGVRLRMSLVNRHQSNGVERTHREILKFLSMLVSDERMANLWSKPHVLGIIQFIVNSQVSGETGKSPFHFLFGTLDERWLRMPDPTRSAGRSNVFMRQLDDNIRSVREAAFDVLSKVQAKRLKQVLNTYQIGDLVLVDVRDSKPTKLSPNFLGPYSVQEVFKADVTIKHLVTEDVRVVHMEKIKPFFAGSYEEAYKAALIDHGQYVVDRLLSWAGDPDKRSNMSYLVRFMDGDELWLPHSRDLTESAPFQEFCRSHPALTPLLSNADEWKRRCAVMNKAAIDSVRPGMICFVDLRCWGWDWFVGLRLERIHELTYVVGCSYKSWENRSKTRILLACSLFGESYVWKMSDIMCHGMTLEVSEGMVLVDEHFCEDHPQVLLR